LQKTSAPIIDPAIKQLYIPVKVAAFSGNPKNVFEALLLASATVRFSETKSGFNVECSQEKNYLVPISAKGVLPVDFNNAKTIKIKLAEIPQEPFLPMIYQEPHAALVSADKYKTYARDFASYLSANCKLTLWRSPATGLVSTPGESERDFRIRLSQTASEKRDTAVAKLREKYQSRMLTLQEKIRLAENKIDQEEAQAKQSELDSAISIGATVIGAFMGRKMIGSSTVGRATTAARGVNRAAKQRQDVELARSNQAELQAKLDEVEGQFRAEAQALSSRFDSQAEVLETTEILPKKTAITVNLVALAWVKG